MEYLLRILALVVKTASADDLGNGYHLVYGGKLDMDSQEIGVVWYKKETFESDMAAMVDREEMHDTYEGWLQRAKERWKTLSEQGFTLVKIPFKLEEFSRWCKKNGLKMNGNARAQWASEMAAIRHIKGNFTQYQ